MHTTHELMEVPLRPGRIASREEWGRITAELDDQGRILCLHLDEQLDPRVLEDALERARPQLEA